MTNLEKQLDEALGITEDGATTHPNQSINHPALGANRGNVPEKGSKKGKKKECPKDQGPAYQ